MQPVSVIFEHHLLVPHDTWENCFTAHLREDFFEWLSVNVGFGFPMPVLGWDAKVELAKENEIAWIWYDDRRKGVDARQWSTKGFMLMFLNPRLATLAKLTWGGK